VASHATIPRVRRALARRIAASSVTSIAGAIDAPCVLALLGECVPATQAHHMEDH
jgi:hypothetical protein